MKLARAVRDELAQEHRYAHIVRVARLSERLAAAHRIDPLRARIAGMLHDLARLYPAERLLRECADRQLPVDSFEAGNPIVLHARLSAELARERYGVDDPAILSAIRKHTVAAEVMSPLDAVVYLADGLEPGRAFEERAALVELAFRDLPAAMRAALTSSIAYMRGHGIAVAPQTYAAARTYGLDAVLEEKHPV